MVLRPKAGFTLTGVAANFFTVAGATATNAVNSGSVIVEFAAAGVVSDIDITFTGVTANGTTSTSDSTALTLSFSADPESLTADNIYVIGATKRALTGTGTTRSLAISNITVDNGGIVYAIVASPAGYAVTGSPQTAVVYKAPATGTGLANTNAIVAQNVAGTTYAAGLARSYNGGYTDWYLPSMDELNKLYLNRTAIGGFAASYYWSSSEFDNDRVWCLDFNSNYSEPSYKDITWRVRAVRSF
jgi:hypothetical protein